jgi:hypothetical protein
LNLIKVLGSFLFPAIFIIFSLIKGYISPTIKLGALGIPSYRTFSLEEIEAATKNFDTSSFIGECTNGQVDAQLNKIVTACNIIPHGRYDTWKHSTNLDARAELYMHRGGCSPSRVSSYYKIIILAPSPSFI